MSTIAVLFICLGVVVHDVVIGVDPFEGDFVRLQCVERREITGCTKSLMEAYPESEMGLSKKEKSINEPNTYVYLHTRRNKEEAEFLHECPGILPNNTLYNPKRRTIIVIHGYLESVCGIAWMREMKIQLLYRGDYNVILIDWAWGNQLDYAGAADNVKIVGEQVAFLIKKIMNQKKISAKKFHIIGHSLGAQAAAFAGKSMKQYGKIRRITGLDPAGPGFRNISRNERLTNEDAEKVDVIHTNFGKCIAAGGEYPIPVGHADFFVNGGSIQWSCVIRNIGSFLKGDILHGSVALLIPFCFHQQSVDYFIASINPCQCLFLGVEAEDYASSKGMSCDGSKCAVMGLDWETFPGNSLDGGLHKYYVSTTLTCPYCDTKMFQKVKHLYVQNKTHCFNP